MALPIVIPEICMGVALLLFFANTGMMETVVSWVWPFNLANIIIAHVAFCFPFVTVVVRSRLVGFNRQLEEGGLKVKESQGAILDATIIESAARPRRELEAIAVDREEEAVDYKVNETESLSKDPDATWLKKGKKSYFGYKGFAIVDQEDGYIDQVHVTPAHISEMTEFKTVIKDRKDKRIYGDKGYASKSNKESLRDKGIKNGLMEKAKKNKPLTHWQKRFNHLISKIR